MSSPTQRALCTYTFVATVAACATPADKVSEAGPPSAPTATPVGAPEAARYDSAARLAHDGLDKPFAVVDLATTAGAESLKAAWRFRDVRIVERDARAAGPDRKPSGARVRAQAVSPVPGEAAFDAEGWSSIEAEQLDTRRSSGKLAFGWYRTSLTMPASVGGQTTSGKTAVLEIVADDYTEVWVNGALSRPLGRQGAGLVSGFNAPNRIILSRDARPGESFDVSVFVANGPLSANVDNFIWVRSATLDFHEPPARPRETFGRVRRLDPAADAIIPLDARIEKVASGVEFAEGPLWSNGSLLFSDPNRNQILRYGEQDGLSVFRVKSGYRGADVGRYHQPGSNGLTLDGHGRLTACEHGNRRVTRTDRTGALEVLADRFEGKRLNSPNDLVYRSDGSLYFSDPPFGLPRTYDDPAKELPFSGVYRWSEAGLQLVAKDLRGPNGLAFSPDEKSLYVGDWDEKHKVVVRYDVLADGSLGSATPFLDLTTSPGAEAIDGVKVDELGNVYVSGPGGLTIADSTGKPIAVVELEQQPANFAWGDDGRTLYLAARTAVYRIALSVRGIRPEPSAGP